MIDISAIIDNCDTYTLLQYVFPTQQKRVKNFLDSLQYVHSVKEVYLFGSSLRDDCVLDDDIDVLILVDSFSDNLHDILDISFRYKIHMRIYLKISLSKTKSDIIRNSLLVYKR